MNDNNTAQVPGSLNYTPQQPGNPEIGGERISSISSFNETAPATEATSEKEPIYETAPPQETKQKSPETQEPEAPLLTKTQQPQPKIVDKSTEKMQLHHLVNAHDKLTNKADSEEEEFIKEVETAHEHK